VFRPIIRLEALDAQLLLSYVPSGCSCKHVLILQLYNENYPVIRPKVYPDHDRASSVYASDARVTLAERYEMLRGDRKEYCEEHYEAWRYHASNDIQAGAQRCRITDSLHSEIGSN
jgi:hypothetical protein